MKKILVFFMGILLAFAGRTQINLSVTNPYEQDFSGFTGGSMASPSASMPNANSLILTGIVTPVTTDYLYQANKVARVSSSTNNGKFKTQQIVCNTYDSIVVSFDAAPWIQSTTHYPAVIKITYGSNVKHVIIPGSTLISDEWTVGYPDVFTNYSVSFEAVSGEQIEFASAYGSQVNGVTYNSSNCDRRFFFDNLKIEGMSYNFAEFTPTPSSMSFCTGTTAAAILSLYNTSMPTIEIEDQNAPANQYVVALTWELDPSFDENIPATYFAKASFDLPAGLNNPGGYDTWFEMPFDINSALAPKLAIDFGDFIDDGENIPTYTMCKENEIIITLEDGVNPIWMYIMTDDPGMNGGFEGEMGLFSTRIDNLPSNFFSPTGIIGTYHYQLLKLEDANCTSLTTGTATQNEFFIDVKTVADPQPTTTFCYGDLLPTGDNSDPSNPITWVWKLGAAVVTNATVSGPYTVIATNGLGCTVSKSISLTVNPLPTVSVNLNAYSQNENDEYVMCKGAEIPIELIGAEPLELTLLVPNGITLPTTAGIHQIVAGQAGTFSFEFVSLIDGNGCSAVNPNANFDVLVNPLPTVSVDLSDYLVGAQYVMCEGNAIPLELIGAEPLELTLFAPNGITLPTTAGTHQIVAGQAGTFSFEFVSLTDGNGCSAINPNMDFDVLVKKSPTLSIGFGSVTISDDDGIPVYNMCMGNSVDLTFGGEVGSNVVLTIETNDPGMFPDGNGIVVMPAIPIITGGFTTIPDMGPTVDLDLPIYHYNLISLVSDNGCSSDTTGTATPNTFNVAVFDAPIQPLAIDLEPENGEAVCSSYTLLNDPEAGVTWTWTTMIESIETEVVEATLIGVNTYTLYATSIYNCGNKTVDISVEILEAPQTPTFTPDAICIGAEYSLVETYSSEDYALLWYSDNQGEEEITELTFTPSATATYYAKYSNGICISELGEFVLTVNPLPTSTPTYTTPQPACDSYTLPTAPSTTTDIWAWSDVSPVTATGDYTLIVTTTENCSATATLTVTITATPAAPTLTSITDETCQSELPYDLTAIFDGGTWTLINSEDTPDAVNIGGDYTVTTETNGCISSASTFTLTVNQADITIEREGNVLTATEGFDSYSWTFNGEPLLDENSEPITTNTITLLENGLYKVVVEDPITGCEGYDEMDVIGVSVKTIVTSNVSVYPNPSNGEFTIDLTSIEKANRYQIIDMKGAIVTESIITDNLQKVNINVVPGNYTVKVITDTKAYIETIIIK